MRLYGSSYVPIITHGSGIRAFEEFHCIDNQDRATRFFS